MKSDEYADRLNGGTTRPNWAACRPANNIQSILTSSTGVVDLEAKR